MKKMLVGCLIALVLITSVSFAQSYEALKASFPIVIDGERWTTDKPIVVINGSTYLPLRAIGEVLETSVNWNDSLRRVEIDSTKTVITGNKTNQTESLDQKYEAIEASFPIIIDGEEWRADKPIVVINGSTYLPLRAIGEVLGTDIEWNDNLHRVEVGSLGYLTGEKRDNFINMLIEKNVFLTKDMPIKDVADYVDVYLIDATTYDYNKAIYEVGFMATDEEFIVTKYFTKAGEEVERFWEEDVFGNRTESWKEVDAPLPYCYIFGTLAGGKERQEIGVYEMGEKIIIPDCTLEPPYEDGVEYVFNCWLNPRTDKFYRPGDEMVAPNNSVELYAIFLEPEKNKDTHIEPAKSSNRVETGEGNKGDFVLKINGGTIEESEFKTYLAWEMYYMESIMGSSIDWEAFDEIEEILNKDVAKQAAKDLMVNTKVLVQEAHKNNIELTEEEMQTITSRLEVGPNFNGISKDDFLKMLKDTALATKLETSMDDEETIHDLINNAEVEIGDKYYQIDYKEFYIE